MNRRIYTSAHPATGDLYVDTSLYMSGDLVASAEVVEGVIYGGDGAIAFDPPAMSGVGSGIATYGAGFVRSLPLKADGSGLPRGGGSGQPALAALTLYARAIPRLSGLGMAVSAPLSVVGSGAGYARGYGALECAPLSVFGSAVAPGRGVGALAWPPLTAFGAGIYWKQHGRGALVAVPLTVSGRDERLQPAFGVGYGSFVGAALSATGLTGGIGGANLNLPAPQLYGYDVVRGDGLIFFNPMFVDNIGTIAAAMVEAVGVRSAVSIRAGLLIDESFAVTAAASAQPTYALGDRLRLPHTLTPTLELIARTRDRLTLTDWIGYIAQALAEEGFSLTDTSVQSYTYLAHAAEAVQALDGLTPVLEARGAMTDAVALADRVAFVAQALAAEGIALADAATWDYAALARAAEAVLVAERAGLALEATARLTEGFAVRDALLYIAKALGRETLTVTDTTSEVFAYLARVAEIISTVDRLSPTLAVQARILETLLAHEVAGLIDALTMAETLTLADDLHQAALARLLTAENLALLDQQTPSFLFLATGQESAAFADAAALSLTALLRLGETLAFIGRLPLGDEDFQAWTLNADTLGVTQYNRFPFNGFATMIGKTYGTTETGLYELSGDTDDGDPIDAWIQTGDIAWGGMAEANVPRAYLFLGSGDEVYLKTVTSRFGERTEHWYRLEARAGDERTRRVRLGRGVRGTRWAFEVRNIDGGALDLRGFDVMPVLLRRRG